VSVVSAPLLVVVLRSSIHFTTDFAHRTGALLGRLLWTPYGGGGISPDSIPIPSWQSLKGVITKANQGSKIYRNGPDVSANANFTFYVCADQQA
jgi:hypothetical protein